jgi:NADPH:quinone reductase-like Zn-dependent oxidoreductase
MRAIAIEEFGGPEQLKPMALPRPKPEKGEVLIHVVSAGVNRVDALVREGHLQGRLPHRFPLIPGWDVAGVVEELGEGATNFRKGDRVWALAMKPDLQWGCYAEYVSVPQTSAARMPAKLLFEEAAGVPLAALSAQQCLFARPGLGSGSTVLVHAACGGVGHFAIQLARLTGAKVYGTAGTQKQPFLLSLGATAGIDYEADDFVGALKRHCPEGVDLVVDAVGGEVLERSYSVLKPGGRLVSIVDEPSAEAAERQGAHAHSLMVKPDADQLSHFSTLFDMKKLKVHVQKIYGLGDAAEAHRVIETTHVQGKLVLNI